MAGVHELYPADTVDEPRLLEGRAATAAAADDDPIKVICPLFSRLAPIGPAPWPPRPDGLRPAVGDRCLIAISDQGQPWVVAWTPTA